MPREIDKIIIHCSDSTFGSRDKINQWHKERGFGVNAIDGKVYNIGYHYVINNGFKDKGVPEPDWDGVLESGRPLNLAGAHCKGHNSNSIGICMIGVDSFTESQYETLVVLLRQLMVEYKLDKEDIYGHYEFSSKTCPNFDVEKLVEERL
jgi:N-acetylmuramoyl-L-alanine amidase